MPTYPDELKNYEWYEQRSAELEQKVERLEAALRAIIEEYAKECPMLPPCHELQNRGELKYPHECFTCHVRQIAKQALEGE